MGRQHPFMHQCVKQLEDRYGVHMNMQQSLVHVWSFQRLAEHLNFSGCELLIVDTEGFDVRILRSMIAYCSQCATDGTSDFWPYVIQFETQGHADILDGTNSEWAIISELEAYGYVLLYCSNFDTYLARQNQLRYNEHILKWAQSLICARCGAREKFPYVLAKHDRQVYCRNCDIELSRSRVKASYYSS